MVVGKYYTACLMSQHRLHHQPGVYRRLGKGSFLDKGCIVHPVLRIKAQDIKCLVSPSGKKGNGVVPGLG